MPYMLEMTQLSLLHTVILFPLRRFHSSLSGSKCKNHPAKQHRRLLVGLFTGLKTDTWSQMDFGSQPVFTSNITLVIFNSLSHPSRVHTPTLHLAKNIHLYLKLLFQSYGFFLLCMLNALVEIILKCNH